MKDVKVLPFDRIPGTKDVQYDSVVVDEAQDLINFDDLSRFDQALQGGLENGRWFILLDSNNQRGLVGSYDEDAMEYLRSFRPVDLILTDNCRNTREIVSRTQEMTGADVGISTAGAGPEVEVVFGATPELRAAAVSAHLETLIRAGVEPNDIVLLSPLAFQESVFGRLSVGWRRRIDILDLHGLRRRPESRLGFATTADFKGLESRFVVLADVAVRDQQLDLPALYVGMTRARVGLWIVLDEQVKEVLSAPLQ